MDFSETEKKIREEVIQPMLDYRRECGKDCGYNLFHVLRCKKILLRYLRRLKKLKEKSREGILSEVRRVVLQLNKLNRATDGCLIETGERESLFFVIRDAALACGLATEDEEEDITFEWREW